MTSLFSLLFTFTKQIRIDELEEELERSINASVDLGVENQMIGKSQLFF